MGRVGFEPTCISLLFCFAVSILKLVPCDGFEPSLIGFQSIVLPLTLLRDMIAFNNSYNVFATDHFTTGSNFSNPSLWYIIVITMKPAFINAQSICHFMKIVKRIWKTNQMSLGIAKKSHSERTPRTSGSGTVLAFCILMNSSQKDS